MTNILAQRTEEIFYRNGQQLFDNHHFEDHILHNVPVQIYLDREHSDVGFIEQYCPDYVKVNNVFYRRSHFTFVSRPGY